MVSTLSVDQNRLFNSRPFI